MKLYFSPAACSLSPRIALLEAGLQFSTEQVDLGKKLTASGADFRSINPNGYVPALQLADGTVLTEGPAIVQYVADLAPASKLAPAAGTIERYQLMEWLNYISSEVHKPFITLFNRAASDEMRDAARRVLSARFRYLSSKLEGKDYLMGDQFTVADGYLFTVLNWTNLLKLSLADWPVLESYLSRMAARPAVQQALRDEGLLG